MLRLSDLRLMAVPVRAHVYGTLCSRMSTLLARPSTTCTTRSSAVYPSFVTRIRFSPGGSLEIVIGAVPQPIPFTVTRAPTGSVVTTSWVVATGWVVATSWVLETTAGGASAGFVAATGSQDGEGGVAGGGGTGSGGPD